MRWPFIISMVGILILFLGLTMICPLLCGLYYGDTSIKPILISMILSILSGGTLYLGSQKGKLGQYQSS